MDMGIEQGHVLDGVADRCGVVMGHGALRQTCCQQKDSDGKSGQCSGHQVRLSGEMLWMVGGGWSVRRRINASFGQGEYFLFRVRLISLP